MSTSLEASVGKLVGQVELLLNRDDKAEINRKALYEKVEEVGRDVLKLNARMTVAEDKLVEHQPTITEFITVKHKVQTAGTIGKWLWGAGGILLTIVAFIVTKVGDYISIVPK